MIKKLLLTFSFIALVTITYGGTTYMSQAGEKITVSEELANTLNILKNLYNEGVITEEEFSSAKSMLLDPVSTSGKKTKKNLTAAERKRLKEAEENKLKAQKMLLKEEAKAERERIKQASLEEQERIKAEKAARRAERERIKQASLDEKKRITEEREKACADDPKGKGCKSAKLQLTKILKKIKIKSIEDSEKAKEERTLEKQAFEERKKRIAKQRELEKQASLEEKERNKAERAERKAERKRLKAKWKKACSDDPESKTCKEGKPSEKIKNVLKKIEKKLGG